MEYHIFIQGEGNGQAGVLYGAWNMDDEKRMSDSALQITTGCDGIKNGINKKQDIIFGQHVFVMHIFQD